MYIGVFLGAIVLAGCNANEESIDQVQVKEEITEDATNGQAVEGKNLPDTNKEEVVSEVPLELTKEQKEDYYQQYVEIVEEINAEGNGKYTLEVEPFDEFKEEDWIDPEEFRQMAEDRATWEFTSKNFGGDPVE